MNRRVLRMPVKMDRLLNYKNKFFGFIAIMSVAIIVVQASMMLVGAWQIGIGWDEVFHVSLQWVQPYYAERSAGVFGVYGYSTQYLGHLLNIALGDEIWVTEYQQTPYSYALRHLSYAFLGFLCVVLVGYVTYLMTRRAWVALFGSACLAALPVWTGHAMMNPKDIPVATGYTMVTAGLVALLYARGFRRSRLAHPAVGFSLIAIGMFVAAGFRLGMSVPLVMTVGLFLFTLMFRRHPPSWRIFDASTAVGGLCLGGGLILLGNSYLLSGMSLELLRAVVLGSKSYPWSGETLFSGELVQSTSLPAWYWVGWLFFSVPVLLAAFAAVGVFWSGRQIISELRHSYVPRSPAPTAVVLVAMQAFTLPTIVTAVGAVDYDAQRHHLYVFPALAVFSALGVWRAGELVTGDASFTLRRCRRAGAVGLVLTVAMALVIPTIEAYRLYPYNYIYLNPIASIQGVAGRWETDYWGLSLREAQQLVPENAALSYVGPPDTFKVYAGEQGDKYDGPLLTNGTPWTIVLRRADWGVPAGCREVRTVQRPLRWETLTLSSVARC